MKIIFPKCNYEVNLFERNDDGSLGSCYCTKTFATQYEVKTFLEQRSRNEVFHYSVQLIGGICSW